MAWRNELTRTSLSSTKGSAMSCSRVGTTPCISTHWRPTRWKKLSRKGPGSPGGHHVQPWASNGPLQQRRQRVSWAALEHCQQFRGSDPPPLLSTRETHLECLKTARNLLWFCEINGSFQFRNLWKWLVVICAWLLSNTGTAVIWYRRLTLSWAVVLSYTLAWPSLIWWWITWIQPGTIFYLPGQNGLFLNPFSGKYGQKGSASLPYPLRLDFFFWYFFPHHTWNLKMGRGSTFYQANTPISILNLPYEMFSFRTWVMYRAGSVYLEAMDSSCTSFTPQIG